MIGSEGRLRRSRRKSKSALRIFYGAIKQLSAARNARLRADIHYVGQLIQRC
jgi:hypothetical protein